MDIAEHRIRLVHQQIPYYYIPGSQKQKGTPQRDTVTVEGGNVTYTRIADTRITQRESHRV